MKPKFELGERVRFKDYVFTDPNYTPYFDAYKGQEFIVIEYMPDDGVEFSELGAKSFKNPGFVYDHIGLICCTAEVQVQVFMTTKRSLADLAAGFVHDWDLEEVQQS